MPGFVVLGFPFAAVGFVWAAFVVAGLIGVGLAGLCFTNWPNVNPVESITMLLTKSNFFTNERLLKLARLRIEGIAYTIT